MRSKHQNMGPNVHVFLVYLLGLIPYFDDVLFKIGIGEVPFLHQITFSIWPSTQSMAEFARHDGPHAKAISAVRKGLWFKEELYARFAVLDSQGCWMGQDPLKMKDTQ